MARHECHCGAHSEAKHDRRIALLYDSFISFKEIPHVTAMLITQAKDSIHLVAPPRRRSFLAKNEHSEECIGLQQKEPYLVTEANRYRATHANLITQLTLLTEVHEGKRRQKTGGASSA